MADGEGGDGGANGGRVSAGGDAIGGSASEEDAAGENGTSDAGAGAVGGDEDAYGGLLGAFPYAFRRTDSTLLRVYVTLGGLLALALSVAFASSFLLAISRSSGLATGGTSSFVRSFVVLAGFLVVLPLLAPVIFAARSHRRGAGSPRHDVALAATGFAYAASLYFAAVASAPPQFQTPDAGPVAGLLYRIPRVASPLIPLVAAGLVYLAHRRYRT